MTAFRGKNLRSGDLAEELGCMLLRSVALVAPVPRTEDVGIDVVATLMRPYDSYKYIAEDSFYIQIKSVSVKEVCFEGDQVSWLKALELPFFIATVDRSISTIKLYGTHSVSDAFVERQDRTRVNLKLQEDYLGDITDKNDNVDIPLGPPIIEWSMDTIEAEPDFIIRFYELMKPHIQLIKRSIETRRVDYVDMVSWEAGKPPVVFANKLKAVSNGTDAENISAPYFTTRLFNIFHKPDLAVMRSLYRLCEEQLHLLGHFHTINGKEELIPWTIPMEDLNEE